MEIEKIFQEWRNEIEKGKTVPFLVGFGAVLMGDRVSSKELIDQSVRARMYSGIERRGTIPARPR